MHLQPNQNLFGFPALEIRRLMRECGFSSFSLGIVADTLKITRPKAEKLASALVKDGFFGDHSKNIPDTLVGVQMNGESDRSRVYQLTPKAHALRMARARKPIKRETAERLVAHFLERAEQVNKDPDLLYWIDEVIAFGSYITEAPTLGDIDLGVQYTRRTRDDTLWRTLYYRSLAMAQSSGRRLATVIDKVGWPQREIEMRLRNRSSSFHLQELREEGDFIRTLPHVRLYTRKL